MKRQTPAVGAFPIGDKLPDMFAKYFIGQAYLAPLTRQADLNCPVANVTFEPGCRNNWHSHTGGQILVAVSGRGYYQEKGKPARLLLPGDVVEIVPDVVHWHGAAPDSWFSHLAIECNPQTNRNTWLEAVDDEQYRAATQTPETDGLTAEAAEGRRQWFPCDEASELAVADPELAEVFDNFVFGDVQRQVRLDMRTRILVTLASTVAQHTPREFERMLRAALANGISPVEIKEVIYQAAAYVGVPRVREMLATANAFFESQGIRLPLPPQGTTSRDDRQAKGLAKQRAYFGEAIDRNYQTAPKNQLHFQHYLSANCFGDYYTRTGLDDRMRELVTFSILISLGGCEPQVKGHVQGNANLGNGKEVLLDVVTQLCPYIGYPRTLNALACVNAVLPEP